MNEFETRVFTLAADRRFASDSPERGFLVGERDSRVVRGQPYVAILGLLDGRRTVADIAESLADEMPAIEVSYRVKQLHELGFISAECDVLDGPRRAFWSARGVPAEQLKERLHTCSLAVRACADADPAPLKAALSGIGLPLVDPSPALTAPALTVVVTPGYLHEQLAEVNRQFVGAGACWLPVCTDGLQAMVGPLLQPGGPCWRCVATRLRHNRPEVTRLQQKTGAPMTWPVARSGAAAGAAFAATAIARYLLEGDETLRSHLLALDVAEFQRTAHPVVRRPQCPVCGDPALVATRARAPVRLQPRPRVVEADDGGPDGGHRAATCAKTWQRAQSLISPLTGIIREIGPSPLHDPPRMSYGAVVATVPVGDGAGSFTQLSAGKGRGEAQARVSAACEALERYSARMHGDELRVRARIDQLDGAVAPESLQFFSQRQRVSPPPRADLVVPPASDPTVAIDWTPVWSLTRERQRYLPTEYCYLRVPGATVCPGNSNGNAAGASLECAVLQGLLELIERDAVAIWWYNRIPRPRATLADDRRLDELRAYYDKLGWDLALLDITHDLGVPVCVAVAQNRHADAMTMGFGAHLDPDIAIWRALTEINQFFDPNRARSWDPACVGRPAWLRPDPDARAPDKLELAGDMDLLSDVTSLVDRLAARDLEVLVLDQTQPDIGLPVVKVVVPGLRPFWPQFGPGRLYDVPVTLGWLDGAHREDELNPVVLLT